MRSCSRADQNLLGAASRRPAAPGPAPGQAERQAGLPDRRWKDPRAVAVRGHRRRPCLVLPRRRAPHRVVGCLPGRSPTHNWPLTRSGAGIRSPAGETVRSLADRSAEQDGRRLPLGYRTLGADERIVGVRSGPGGPRLGIRSQGRAGGPHRLTGAPIELGVHGAPRAGLTASPHDPSSRSVATKCRLETRTRGSGQCKAGRKSGLSAKAISMPPPRRVAAGRLLHLQGTAPAGTTHSTG